MKRTILTHHAQIPTILQQFFAREGDTLFDLEVKDIRQWIASFFPPEVSLYEQAKRVQGLDLQLFRENHSDSGFLREVIRDRRLLDEQRIAVAELPVHPELKSVLSALQGRDYARFFEQLQGSSFEGFLISEEPYDPFEQEVVAVLLAHGAKKLAVLPKADSHRSWQVPVNDEAAQFETALQYIIREDLPLEDCAFVLCKEDEDTVLEALLQRYQVPFRPLRAETSLPARKLQALLRYYQEPCRANAEEIAALRIFGRDHEAFYRYQEDHASSFDLNIPYERLQQETRYYADTEKKAEAVRSALAQGLQQLTSCRSLQEALNCAFALIVCGDPEERRLKNFLEERGRLMQDDYLPWLIEELNGCQRQLPGTEGLLISTLQEPVYGKRFLFVFDASQTSYPCFRTLSGLLREEDLSGTAYPSLESRYQAHLQKLSYLEASAETFYFNPAGSYDGKPSEFSYLIEEKKLPRKEMALTRPQALPERKHALDPDLSKAAFLPEGILQGSVSAFERYWQCPYSYFLSYGLKLKDPQTFGLDPASFGTILHDFFEKLLTKYGKAYTETSEEDWQELLEPHFERLLRLYPRRQKEIADARENLLLSLQQEFRFLRQMEAETAYQPTAFEHRFDTLLYDEEDLKLRLYGSIDRVDTCGEDFRILDYKTSVHELKEKEIVSGRQLQLLTYLLLYAAESGKTPAGAFYLNVTHPRSRQEEYDASLSKGIYEKEADPQKNFLSSHVLKGKVLQQVEGEYNALSCLQGGGKNGMRKDACFDPEKVKDAFHTIYRELYRRLSEGEIPLEPSEGACTFCSYAEICRFKGREGYTERILYPQSLRTEEEEE